jgi:hypothetical protein
VISDLISILAIVLHSSKKKARFRAAENKRKRERRARHNGAPAS